MTTTAIEYQNGWAAYRGDQPSARILANQHNARRVLNEYARRPGSACLGDLSSEDYYCDLTDLIADLMHLADGEGLDGEEALQTAALNYHAEREEQ